MAPPKSKAKFETLGEIFRAARALTGDSQVEIARRAGVAANHVNRLERGEKTVPRFDTVVKIADQLGLSLDEIAIRSGIRQGSAEPSSAELVLSKRSVRVLRELVDRLEEISSAARSTADKLEVRAPQASLRGKLS